MGNNSRKLLVALVSLLALASTAFGQTGSKKSSAALNTEVNVFWPDNTQGQITPFNARQTLLDIIASYANISGGTTLTPPVVIGTTNAARLLNLGSNFVAAQPAEFNINDNQAPADSRFCYFGFNVTNGVNGGAILSTCGTDSNPVNWAAASLSVEKT